MGNDNRKGEKVKMQQTNRDLSITQEKQTIEDAITDFFKSGHIYTEPEINFGEPVGREI